MSDFGPPLPSDFSNPQATEDLLFLVYEELRRIASAQLAQERPGQTLQATALVHEAYVRLVVNAASGDVVSASTTTRLAT